MNRWNFSDLSSLVGGGKIVFPKEGKLKPMTIIAAIFESDDSILVSADSQVTESPSMLRSLTALKLQSHNTAPLAWGAAGDYSLGVRFSEWLREYEFPPKDRDKLRDDLSKKLAELNGKQRKIIKLSGVEVKEENLCDALIATWLDGPVIFDAENNGIATFVSREQGFKAIGSGSYHFSLVYTAFQIIKPPASVAVLFHLAMRVAANKAQQCAEPIHVWRITKDGIKDISQELNPPNPQEEKPESK